jgi:hypothetical protein
MARRAVTKLVITSPSARYELDIEPGGVQRELISIYNSQLS